MQVVRLNLYQCDREFQIEIGGGGFGYRLLGPKFDGSSRLIKSVILSDRDKEEIIGYVKPDARAIEEELASYKKDAKHTADIIFEAVTKVALEKDQEYQSLLEHHEIQTKELREERDRLRERLETFADFILEECDEWALAHDAARKAKQVLGGDHD